MTFTLKTVVYNWNFLKTIKLLRLYGQRDSNSSLDASCIMVSFETHTHNIFYCEIL